MFSKYSTREESITKVKRFQETDMADKCKHGHWFVKRNGPQGKFWGCSHFPQCKQTKPFKETDTEIDLRFLDSRFNKY